MERDFGIWQHFVVPWDYLEVKNKWNIYKKTKKTKITQSRKPWESHLWRTRLKSHGSLNLSQPISKEARAADMSIISQIA